MVLIFFKNTKQNPEFHGKKKSFQNKGIYVKQTIEIHHQQICTPRNAKLNSSSCREMIPDGNSDHWEGMKGMGNGKYMDKHKRWDGGLALISLKFVRLLKYLSVTVTFQKKAKLQKRWRVSS